MIAAVTTVLNEADIIRFTMQHLYLEGVDQIYVAHGASTDDTLNEMLRAAAGEHPLFVIQDRNEFHRQPYWIQRLAEMAGTAGAEWIVPFDADEFWYSTDGGSLASTLRSMPPSVGKVDVPMFRHLDWYQRLELGTLPKVAYRYTPGVIVTNGNHGCSAIGTHVMGHLALREICYRDFDHFVFKTRERCALLDPSLPNGEGAHQTQYRDMSLEQLHDAWDAYCNIPRVRDPIPSRLTEHP